MLQRQVQINEELNDNIHKLKDLNREMEYAWSQKYETATRDKDLLIAALKDGNERTLTMLRHDFEKKISDQQSHFKEDVLKMDSEYKKQRKDLSEKYEQLKGKYQKLTLKNEEIKEILKLVADSDSKKDSLLEEVRVSAKE